MSSMRFPIRRRAAARAATLLAALAASCAPSSAPEQIDVRSAQQKLVSLNPCLDAILVQVANPDQILAISHYSHDEASSSLPLSVAREYKAIGGTVEEILALEPDMVLASSFLAPSTSAAMRDLDVRFRTFSSPASVTQSLAQVRYVAKLAGQESAGNDLSGAITQSVKRHSARKYHQPISAVLWQPGEIVPGEQTLISELMRKAGFTSHSEAIGMGQADYLPLEVLLANPPEVLLVAGTSRGQLHPSLQSIEGMRVETLDPKLLYCGGPTIIAAMERLAEIRDSVHLERAL